MRAPTKECGRALADSKRHCISQVGDAEVILCDSTEFAARAGEAGASSVQLLVYRSMWHCWPMYSQLATDVGEQPLAEGQWALDDLSSFLTQLE